MLNSSIRVDPGPRNRVPTSLLALKVFISSIRVDPGPNVITSPENTYPRGKHGENKVHRSSACAISDSYSQEFCYVYETPEMLSLIVIHL